MFSSVFGAVGQTVRAIIEGVKTYRRYGETYRELLALDDRQLQDIGISRGMIRTVAVTGVHHVGEVAMWQAGYANDYRKHAA